MLQRATELVYDEQMSPLWCAGCKVMLSPGVIISIAEHPVLGERYGPYYLHMSCWEVHPWNSKGEAS